VLTIPANTDDPWTATKLPPPPPTAFEATGAFDPLPPVSAKSAKTVIGAISSNSVEATGEFGNIADAPTNSDRGNPRTPVPMDQTIAPTPESVDQTMAPENSPPASIVGSGMKTKLPVKRSTVTVPDAGTDQTIGGVAPSEDDAPPRKAKKSVSDLDMPDVMGGYAIIKELGRGGMGAVFLARQMSLDRPVALKVMNARWASDAVFVARFAREAYAAAQLVHHNVVQIYDIGEQDGMHFFSMEFVEGQSLNDLVRKEGKLDAEMAVGYILQAARGLKFAHDRGMIHRDIKPDNLMLNNQGIVKVADLGLVKTPDMTRIDDELSQGSDSPSSPASTGLRSLPSNVTNANVAMGTPAYMSPEQCRDAAHVDARADIYSLGCTLYVLLTGRPPFQGTTAFEVMSKHATEQVIPPDEIVKRVPKKVSEVLVKMMAKEPDERHQEIGELIKELEIWLGVNSAGPFTPREDHVEELEKAVMAFNQHPTAKLKKLVLQGGVAAIGLVTIGCLLFGAVSIAGGMIGLTLSAIATYFVLHGLQDKGYLFGKARQFVFTSPIMDWVTAGAGGLVFVLILWLTGQIWYWLPLGIVGGALAFGINAVIDRALLRARQAICDELDGMFKRMRVQGLEEDALRQFVGKYSGRTWEPLYEALFGYENKSAMRGLLQRGDGGKASEKHAAWREPLIAWLDVIQVKRQEARERKYLQKIEQKMLEAKGVDKATARDQAEAAADILVQQGEVLKAANREPIVPDEGASKQPAKQRLANVQQMLKNVDAPPKKLPKAPKKPLESAVKIIFSGQLRFLLAAGLLVGGFMWAKQCVNEETASVAAYNVVAKEKGVTLLVAPQLPQAILIDSPTHGSKWDRPLDLAGLPGGGLFQHSNTLIAGVILLISLFFGSGISRVLMSLGALVTFLGPHIGVPMFDTVPAYQVASLAGTAIAIVGMALSPPRKP